MRRRLCSSIVFIRSVAGIALVASMASCSDNPPPTTDCNSDLTKCRIASAGTEAHWDISKLPAGKEYFLVFLSQAPSNNASQLTHPVQITTTNPSAAIAADEAAILDSIRLRTFVPLPPTADLTNVILPPRNPYETAPSQNISDEPTTIQIPNPEDFTTKVDSNQSTPAWWPLNNSQIPAGESSQFSAFSSLPQFFDMKLNNKDGGLNLSSLSADVKAQIDSLDSCLKKTFPKTIELLGRPLFQMNPKPEIQIYLTRFGGTYGGSILGLFSSIDRFKTMDSNPLTGSNKGEILYLAMPSNPSRSCSTAAHEYQHLLSFDYKVLNKLPAENRFDMAEQMNRGLHPEHLGLNEGYSHIVELLTEEAQSVDQHIYDFLTAPTGTSFALETVWGDSRANAKSRGLNTLFHYYGIKRNGGSLQISDSQTRNYLQSLIQSPDTGFKNIAQFFHTTEEELLQDFFVKLSQALYHSDQIQNFIPAKETSGNLTRGISLLDRSTDYPSIPFANPVIHPLQVTSPLVASTNTFTVPAQSIIFMRYIVPKSLNTNSEIKIFANGKAFQFFATQVR